MSLTEHHHWFLAYTFSSCLPDPGRLAVPTRPVVVRAAPTLPGASQAGLPSASAGLLRQPSGGSFHPTRSHSASWRTPLSQCSLAGRLRGRPGRPPGPLIAGTASTMGSSSTESWVLAADSPRPAGSRGRRSAGGTWSQPCPGRPDSRRLAPPCLARPLTLSMAARDQSICRHSPARPAADGAAAPTRQRLARPAAAVSR